MDKISTAKRSAVMRSITKTNTRPEIAVRRALHALGYRFRLHAPELPGRPDIVFRRRGKVIFVHGCFWHQHPGCRLARQPKSNLDYWLPKLQRNQARDTLVRQELRRAGWRTLTVWECETANAGRLAKRLSRYLGTSTG